VDGYGKGEKRRVGMEEFRCRCVSLLLLLLLLLLPANAIAIVIIPIRPRGLFSSRFQSPLSRALAASSTAVPSFFRCFRDSQLRFWCSIAVRFVQSFVHPLHLTSPSTGDSCSLMDCRLVGEAVQTVCGRLF